MGSQLAREEAGDMADWGHLAENVARLVDLMQTWLNYEYANWTADPDEVEARRRKHKKAGIKPPPFPLVQPVASRPKSLQDHLVNEYVETAAQYQLPVEETRQKLISSDDLDALLGI
jgi:hypothetical protein